MRASTVYTTIFALFISTAIASPIAATSLEVREVEIVPRALPDGTTKAPGAQSNGAVEDTCWWKGCAGESA